MEAIGFQNGVLIKGSLNGELSNSVPTKYDTMHVFSLCNRNIEATE